MRADMQRQCDDRNGQHWQGFAWQPGLLRGLLVPFQGRGRTHSGLRPDGCNTAWNRRPSAGDPSSGGPSTSSLPRSAIGAATITNDDDKIDIASLEAAVRKTKEKGFELYRRFRNRGAQREQAEVHRACRAWRQRLCRGWRHTRRGCSDDDVPDGRITDFRKAVQAKRNRRLFVDHTRLVRGHDHLVLATSVVAARYARASDFWAW